MSICQHVGRFIVAQGDGRIHHVNSLEEARRLEAEIKEQGLHAYVQDLDFEMENY